MIKTFFQKLNSKPKQESYLTIISTDELNIKIDFNFTIDTAPIIANILFQLDSGGLTSIIVDEINKECLLKNKNEELQAFMTSLNIIHEANKALNDIHVNRPVIKPTEVFKYTTDQPKFN